MSSSPDDNAPGWAKWAAGLLSLSYGNVAGLAMAATGFDWENILLNLLATFSITAIAAVFLGPISIPIFIALTGLGVGVMQADQAKTKMLKTMKKELVKHLPRLVQEQWQPIYSAVQECFDAYEREVIERVDDDIKARKAELDNLLKQKESREIDREKELTRLHNLEETVDSECRSLEATYEGLIAVAV